MNKVMDADRIYVKGDPVIIADYIAKARLQRGALASNEENQDCESNQFTDKKVLAGA